MWDVPLRTAIQGAIDIMDADAFFVLTGCTAGIIGDDIISVTQEFRDKGHEVYPIDTPGFAGDDNTNTLYFDIDRLII